MAKSLINGIKPSNFKVGDNLDGSPLKDPIQEIAARNIILISLWNDDSWTGFTWEDYQERCRHTVTDLEQEVLDELVQKNYSSLKMRCITLNVRSSPLSKNSLGNNISKYLDSLDSHLSFKAFILLKIILNSRQGISNQSIWWHNYSNIIIIAIF